MPFLNPTDPLPPLAPIGQPVGDNLGGVQEIYLLPQAALLRDPVRRGPAIVGDLALRPGARWQPVRAVLDTAGFDQSFAQDRQQGLYAGKLAGFVAEDTPALAAALLTYRNVRLVLLYRDGNDRLKLAGDTVSWYTLGYGLATDQTTAGRAGYSLELTGRTLRPALFYTGAFDVAGAGPQSGAPAAGAGQVEIYHRDGRLAGVARVGQRVTLTSGFRVALDIR
ncbi:hypothetical protein [Hymenobacter sp. PAMC 26628]|uniref:hypothetical protein n=1 Tax=Hymenobacter sp. PAMC 26628 TaxID=1484118 RepID=UPI0007706B1C|nr:hypothetical protein [Hymenobacter sp. PAMC 26628]AMJ65030.1 hypothetical protein AXW84_06015 [Hymenobacter sp. PAMC 26628]